MAKIIERNVPIAEENITLSGEPATNKFDDWSEEVADRTDDSYKSLGKKGKKSAETKKKIIKNLDELIKEKIE